MITQSGFRNSGSVQGGLRWYLAAGGLGLALIAGATFAARQRAGDERPSAPAVSAANVPATPLASAAQPVLWLVGGQAEAELLQSFAEAFNRDRAARVFSTLSDETLVGVARSDDAVAERAAFLGRWQATLDRTGILVADLRRD